MPLNVAVDIGGTFTDLIGYDDSTGELYNAKSSTTPKDLTLGIFNCVQKGEIDVSQVANLCMAPQKLCRRKEGRTN